jgi:hypothetical protein
MKRIGLLLLTVTTACAYAHHEVADASATRNDAEANTSDSPRTADAGITADAGSSAPTTIATDVTVCAMDTVNLYCVSSAGVLWSEPKAGSAQTTLQSFGSDAPSALATDGTALYFAEGIYVGSLPVAGGTVKGLLSEDVLQYTGGFLLFDAVLYVRDTVQEAPRDSYAVVVVPVAGVPVVGGEQDAGFLTPAGYPAAVIQTVTDGTDLFDLWDGPTGYSIADAGNGPTAYDGSVGNGSSYPAAGGISGIAVDATSFYAVGTGVSGNQRINQVVSIARSSGVVTVLASSPQTCSSVCGQGETWSSLVADGDYLYWGGVGEVLRIAKTGGTPEVIYQQGGLFVPSSWMFDSTWAYWITPDLVSGAGPLMRWKK